MDPTRDSISKRQVVELRESFFLFINPQKNRLWQKFSDNPYLRPAVKKEVNDISSLLDIKIYSEPEMRIFIEFNRRYRNIGYPEALSTDEGLRKYSDYLLLRL